jgi:hypothetical protein
LNEAAAQAACTTGTTGDLYWLIGTCLFFVCVAACIITALITYRNV